MDKQFRDAYVLERGKTFDLSPLEPYVREIKYVLEGTEKDVDIIKSMRISFLEFDPELDVIVPMGRAIASFMLGYLMGILPEVHIGIYRDKDYNFLRIRTPDGTF